MLFRVSLRQSLRAPVRLFSSFLIIALVCAFLCVSMNLRRNALANLHVLRQQFDVVAVPSFRGAVDATGNLTQDTELSYAGYLEVPAQNFDPSQFKNAAGVRDVLVHRQYGAYVNDSDELLREDPKKSEYDDVFIFTYTGNQPKTIQWVTGTDDATRVNIRVDWSATGMEKYPLGGHRQSFRMQNTISQQLIQSRWTDLLSDLGLDAMWPKDDGGDRTGSFILQPGRQYIASGKWIIAYSSGGISLAAVSLDIDYGHSKRTLSYHNDQYSQGWQSSSDSMAYHTTFPCIMPYTEGFWETPAGAYYRDAIDLCQVNRNALTAVTTEDLSLYAPFYSGGVYVSQGRSFTAEDYTGKQVCLVSQYLAELNGWKLGDKLDLSLFEAVYSHNGQASDVQSYYQPLQEVLDADTDTYNLIKEDGFFHQAVYEIVGFYDGNVTKSHWLNDLQYTQAEGIDRRVVILPETSVSALPQVPLTQYNTAILLDDEQVMAFMSHMEASGLLEQKKGSYQVSLTVHDQGLSGMKQSLRQLDSISRLTLYLACVAAGASVILLAVLLRLQSRKEIATLRSLGVRCRQVPLAVLSGVLLVCLLAACLGGLAGNLLSNQVTDFILNTAQADQGDLSFSTVQGTGAEDVLNGLITQSTGIYPLLAVGAVWGVLCLLSVALVMVEANRPPMLRLGMKE